MKPAGIGAIWTISCNCKQMLEAGLEFGLLELTC